MNNNYNLTDLSFNEPYEMESSVMLEEYESNLYNNNLNYFGVSSNLTYDNINIDFYYNQI